MSRNESQRTVCARAVAKTLFEIFIGAHAHSVAKEPDQASAENHQNTNCHKSRNELVPVTCEGGAGIGNESDAADNRREHGKPQRPMRHGTTCSEIRLRGILPAR